ncbi:MAG: hypothetical protein P1Q69_07035 [Candidatus Thorarchaeota archaeon]|nr:hypothetical protein [Candidatus Thorarchaeota archaeon]
MNNIDELINLAIANRDEIENLPKRERIRLQNLLFMRRRYAEDLIRHKENPNYPAIVIDKDKIQSIHIWDDIIQRNNIISSAGGQQTFIYGFQFYIVTWKSTKDGYSVWVSHWVLDKVTQTLYPSKIWICKETSTEVTWKTMLQYEHIPDRHRRIAVPLAKEKWQEEGIFRTTSNFTLHELQSSINRVFKEYDTGEYRDWYLDHQFKTYWTYLLTKTLYANIPPTLRPPPEAIDEFGCIIDDVIESDFGTEFAEIEREILSRASKYPDKTT